MDGLNGKLHPKKFLSLKLGQKKLKFGPQTTNSTSSPLSSTVSESDDNDNVLNSVSISGLCNLGNTCYINCILQVLRFCPHFSSKIMTLSQDLLDDHHSIQQGSDEAIDITGNEVSTEKWQSDDGALVIHLHRLWQRMADKEKQAANKASVLSATKPFKFLSKLKEYRIFDNKLQQDAQELLQFLLTRFHETVQKIIPPSQGSTTLATSANLELGGGELMEDTTSPSLLTSRKRRLVYNEMSGNKKIPKSAAIKYASSCTKLTDFYPIKGDSAGMSERIPEVKISSVSITTKRRCSDFIEEMFQGQLVSQTRCYECDSFTRMTEPFLGISLSVSSHVLPGFPYTTSPIKVGIGGTIHSEREDFGGNGYVGPFSLSWAISKFCHREKLCGDNKYCCERCGHLVEAEKTILFGHLPTVMILHFNRFTTHSGSGLDFSRVSVSKISGNVAVPIAMSFSSWCTQDCLRKEKMYELFAVVVHAGSSCSRGHYTTCVRGKECLSVTTPTTVASRIRDENDWVYFNDEIVETMSQEQLLDLLSPISLYTVYILFYTLKD